MRLSFLHFSSSLIKPARLVWKRPELGKEAPPTGTGGEKYDPRAEARKQLDELNAGLHPKVPNVPRAPKKSPDVVRPPEPIDPGIPGPGRNEWEKFPKLQPLLKEMDKRARKYNNVPIDGYIATNFNSKIKSLRRYYIYKAIVENWTEETLLETYEKEIHDFYDRIGNKKWRDWLSGKMARVWHAISDTSNPGISDDNPHLANRKIKVGDKYKLKGELIQIAAQLKRQIIDCREWEGNSCKQPRKKEELILGSAALGNDTEIKDGEITQHMAELYANLGIVEDQEEQYIKDKFTEEIKKLYWSCIQM